MIIFGIIIICAFFGEYISAHDEISGFFYLKKQDFSQKSGTLKMHYYNMSDMPEIASKQRIFLPHPFYWKTMV